MTEMILNNDKVLKRGSRPFFIAEMNSSHNGDIELAKKMIYKAKEIGCDAVKFQSWTKESLYSSSYYQKNPIAKRIVEKFSLNDNEIKILSNYCKELDIIFSSTPYSFKEIDYLIDECNVPFIKIASMDINNYEFLKYIGKRKKPIILSTGMADIEEIKKAVDIIKGEGNSQICILHCVSMYPVENSDINLNNIKMLENNFSDCLIGYSDHSIGNTAACAAVAMGAVVIEKHFTLDNSKIGMDNQMATEPNEFKKMIELCNETYLCLGNYEREIFAYEREQKKKMRRSLVINKNLIQGDIINREDLVAKRPGDGISVSEIEKIVGCRVNKNIKEDSILYYEDIEGGI